MRVEWNPETQALINSAGFEVTPDDINMAVCQWLRQILRHRRYLERLKSDPQRWARHREKATAYNREYRKLGPKKERGKKGQIYKEDFADRVAQCLKEKPKKQNRDDITYIGSL